jgi:hypothetical protein
MTSSEAALNDKELKISVVYMGQIMAECDCQNHACEIRGYCMAEKIEELEAKRDEVERRRVKWMNKSDELQIKLTKAVSALKYTDNGANHGVMTPTYSETGLRYILRNIRDHARLALEELKGET